MTDSDPKMQAEFGTIGSPAPPTKRNSWDDWPTCPGCGKRRMTHCPGCGEASEEFSLAPYQSQGAEPPPSSLPILDLSDLHEFPLLVCPTCDDHFHPQFYQQCAWCGHAFDDGERVTVTPPMEAMTRREWWTIWGLTALAVGTLVWFAIVLRR